MALLQAWRHVSRMVERASRDCVYRVVVVGAGVEGSSAALHITKCGASPVLLLEQFDTLHSKGSSRGGSRITRRYYHTDYYTRMMREAYQLWGDLEREGGKKLYTKTGGIVFGPRGCHEVESVLKALATCGIPHEVLDASEASRRVPQLNLPHGYECVLEEDGGILSAQGAVKTMQQLYQSCGGVLLDHHRVTEIIPGDPITVVTEKGEFRTETLVITAGPWTPTLTQPLGLSLPLKVLQTEVVYWAVDTQELSAHEQSFPTFRAFPDDTSIHFYGLRAHEHPGLCKICLLDGVEVKPSHTTGVDEQESDSYITIDRVAKFIGQCFKGIDTSPAIVEPCWYTMTPDEDFILDVHPQHSNIVIGAGFSGHGFKLAPVIGKILSELALGLPPSYDLTPFSSTRF